MLSSISRTQRTGLNLSLRTFVTLRDKPVAVYAHDHNGQAKISFSTVPSALHIGVAKMPISEIKTNTQIPPNKFITNQEFMPVVHKMLKNHIHEDTTYISLAQSEGQKAIYFSIYDLRNPPPQARIAEVDDTLGHVRLEKGKIINSSFEANSMYRILTNDGFLRLSDDMHAKVRSECEK